MVWACSVSSKNVSCKNLLIVKLCNWVDWAEPRIISCLVTRVCLGV